MAKLRLVSLLALVALSTTASARDLKVEEKLSDLDQLASVIRSGYGPLKYKAGVLGIEVDALRADYAERISKSKSNAEFYYLINQFVADFRDSHFGAMVPSTYSASLPFSTDLVGGKVLIDTVVRAKLPEATFPFQKGDEVVEFGGKPVGEVLDELSKYMGSGYQLTTRRRAAMLVTARPGERVPVPAGEVSMKIRRGTSAVIDEVKLKWDVAGKPIDEVDANKSDRAPRDFDDISIADLWKGLDGPQFEKTFRCSGDTRTFIPTDATIIMKEPFVAYYHPTAKGNVGYLRIPHYSPTGPAGAREFDIRFAQYEYAVQVLEKNTVGLIIDQDHNCGGSVEWLHRVVGLFMDKPYEPMKFSLLANKQELLEFSGWMNETSPNTIERQGLQTVVDLIRTAWTAGEFMTPRTSIGGETLLNPNAIRYTKPIVMTIDELSGSGGDAFPSLMGGYGRAKLLGTRTMGAGGHVVEQPKLFYSQIGLRMTKSLFYRPDGVAVENNGAVPDYPYEITRDDFTYGYRGYQAFYLSKLSELLP